MTAKFAIRRLLAVLMIAGLAWAPVSRPVVAQPPSHVAMQAMADEMAAEMSPSSMADEMASDMPCCPPKAPTPYGCDKCLFMAACGATCFTGISASFVHPPLTASDAMASPQNDFWPDGLGHPPPEHPPRSLV